MSARRIGLGTAVLGLALALAATGCTKKIHRDARTCARFGDAGGRCAFGAIEGRATLGVGPTATGEGIRIAVLGTDKVAAADREGAFDIEKLVPGTYVLAFTAEGWRAAEATAVVEREKVTVLDPVVLEEETHAPALVGQILLTGRTSHENTLVSLEGGGTAAFTAVDGSFRIEGVAPGEHRLVARHPGFVPLELPVTVVPGAEVDAGTHTLEALTAPGGIVGVAVAEEGGPLAGVSVALTGFEGGAVTDQAGRFQLEGVAPGRYEVVAVAPGRAAIAIPGVSVASGVQTDLGVLVLDLADDRGILRGVARRLMEVDHAGIGVRLVAGGTVVAQTTTGPDGSWELRDLQVGIHSLAFDAAGFPDLTIPAVLVGQGIREAPDATLRRAIRIATTTGSGQVLPSGRKAIFHPGWSGTWAWDGTARTKVRLTGVDAEPTAFDQEERFATLYYESRDEDSSKYEHRLLRAALGTGEVVEASPKPSRLVGTAGAMTFYFDGLGELYALRAAETVGVKVSVNATDAYVAYSDPPFALLNFFQENGQTLVLAVDTESGWFSPVFDFPILDEQGPPRLQNVRSVHLSLQGESGRNRLERFLAWDRDGWIWIDAASNRTWAVSTGPVEAVLGMDTAMFFADHADDASGTVDIRTVDRATGEVATLAQAAQWPPLHLDAGWMLVELADGSVRWLPLRSGVPGPAPFCSAARETFAMVDGNHVCQELDGVLRTADSEGVHTLSTGIGNVISASGVLAWSEAGGVRIATVDGRHVSSLPCELDEVWMHLEGLSAFASCGDGVHIIDLEKGESLHLPDAFECAGNDAGTSAICTGIDPLTSSVSLLAVDRRTGESVIAAPLARFLGQPIWSANGDSVQLPVDSGPIQVHFGASVPTVTACAGSALTIPMAIGDGGHGVWKNSDGVAFTCGPLGAVAPLSASLTRITAVGETGWWLLDDTLLLNLDRGERFPLPSGTWALDTSNDGRRAWIVDYTFALFDVAPAGVTPIAGDASFPLGFGRESIVFVENGSASLYDVDDGSVRLVADEVMDIRWSPVGGALVLHAADDRDQVRLTFVDPEEGLTREIAAGVSPWSLIDAWDGAVWYGAVRDGATGYFRATLATGIEERMIDDEVYSLDHAPGRTYFHASAGTWVEHGGRVLLVHDGSCELMTYPTGANGLLFLGYDDPGYGIWWMELP